MMTRRKEEEKKRRKEEEKKRRKDMGRERVCVGVCVCVFVSGGVQTK